MLYLLLGWPLCHYMTFVSYSLWLKVCFVWCQYSSPPWNSSVCFALWVSSYGEQSEDLCNKGWSPWVTSQGVGSAPWDHVRDSKLPQDLSVTNYLDPLLLLGRWGKLLTLCKMVEPVQCPTDHGILLRNGQKHWEKGLVLVILSSFRIVTLLLIFSIQCHFLPYASFVALLSSSVSECVVCCWIWVCIPAPYSSFCTASKATSLSLSSSC